jgi:peptidoglycan/LPS O-acetylase OafA/YrhL
MKTTTTRPLETGEKDRFIEILRGVSVFLVFYYHYSDRLPYWALNAAAPATLPFQLGKIGVYIFFAISGLLIAKSLEGSRSLADFYAKRISRIWPLFIAASLVIFAFLQVFDPPVVLTGPKQFYESPVGWVDLLGQLFFLNDLGFQWVDGVFWSILVELKFYFIIGLFALAFRRRYATVFGVVALVLASLDIAISHFAGPAGTVVSRVLHGALIAQYLPIFAIGVMMHGRVYGGVFVGNVVLACAQAVYAVADNPDFQIEALVQFSVIFALFLAFDAGVFRSRIMLFLGKYSYAIYLFHQMIGLTIISMLASTLGYDLSMVVAAASVISLSVVCALAVEWRYRRPLTSLLVKVFTLLKLDRARLSLGATENPGGSNGLTPQTPQLNSQSAIVPAPR